MHFFFRRTSRFILICLSDKRLGKRSVPVAVSQLGKLEAHDQPDNGADEQGKTHDAQEDDADETQGSADDALAVQGPPDVDLLGSRGGAADGVLNLLGIFSELLNTYKKDKILCQ